VNDDTSNYIASLVAERDALVADAERYRWLRDSVKESPLRPASYGAAEFPDMRLRFEFPALVSWADYCGRITLDAAIDAARKALSAKEPT
jgi:hypothetical protein